MKLFKLSLAYNFLTQNCLRQGGASSPLPLNFALECAIRKRQENWVGLKLNGTHELLPCAGNVNLLREKIDTIIKNIDAIIDASKDTCLEINIKETKYMSLSHYQKSWQDQDIKMANIV
jgi:hypothetical protein